MMALGTIANEVSKSMWRPQSASAQACLRAVVGMGGTSKGGLFSRTT